jgi:branched-chain amino acid transport system ATP-binding protein
VAKKGIARTFQITNVFKEETVLRNVTVAFHLGWDSSLLGTFLGTRKARRLEDTIHDRALEVLDFMGLSGQSDKIAGELPSGTQKVLAMAIALACDPKLIMLDEPMAGMNPVEKGILSEKIRSIREKGTTVFLVEHDMRTIMSLCDNITVIDFGRKIAEGSPSVVSNDQKTIDAYLGKQESLRAGS